MLKLAISILLAVVATAAVAAERPLSGFYGGLSLRDASTDAGRVALGVPANAVSAFSGSAATDASASRALLFGGYRWSNDLAVEAAFNSADRYALRPADRNRRHGVGLFPATGGLGLTELGGRSWNVDLYTSWTFLNSFALYGRLGYAQSDPMAVPVAVTPDQRRLRDGMNYGVGVRYDLGAALGLKLEYSRLGRFAGEIGSSPLESDQFTLGLQYRF